MAQAYFWCSVHQGGRLLLTYTAADVDTPGFPGVSDCCGAPLERAPLPGDYSFDLKTDGGGDKGFQKFTIHRQVPTRDGLVQVEEVIDSVHKLRQVERDSEQRYRDGEGEPIRFRGYAQDHSNMDRGSFGDAGKIGDRTYDSGSAPQKSNKISTTRHGTRKPKVKVAKGGGVSPLKGI